MVVILAKLIDCMYHSVMQYATMGIYGTFELAISGDDGAMTWKSDLKNIDHLGTAMNISAGIPTLSYHLHQSWTLDEDYAIGGVLCGLANLGNHYDPYFAVRWHQREQPIALRLISDPLSVSQHASVDLLPETRMKSATCSLAHETQLATRAQDLMHRKTTTHVKSGTCRAKQGPSL